MIVTAIKTPIFKEGQDLPVFLFKNLPKIKDGDVVVVTSKIVALAEGRVAEKVDDKTREKLIKAESQYAMKTKYGWLAIRDNMVMAGAGVDESNANGKIILLPKDSFKTASTIRKALLRKFGLKKLGVLITDSRMLPLRSGTTGVAMGYAGIKGQKDYRGLKDIFGRVNKVSRVSVVDSLAAAAVVVMGESAERSPIAVISGAPVEFAERVNRHALDIDIKEDLYQPLFERIKRIKY
ncbi:MAG: coenzyme F420-0:L-glutamate ligase [Patescibacteria group bacterium]|nr:coenzyme F420-0:L-glutamate ligase [Patescibacteria group bacterium]